jgi:DNA repair protein RecN (Recombination protein N)
VLCITHLPQIASYAERHLTVRKQVSGEKTQTSVRRVEGDERLEELAEMIGGQRITDTTRAQAREQLDAAQAETAPTSSLSRSVSRQKASVSTDTTRRGKKIKT